MDKNIYTKEQMPWIDYIEIDENTLERHIIKEKTPKDIFNKYLKSDNYIVISSTGYFSHKKFNKCLIDLKENKIYSVSYDSNSKEEYEYYKDLTNSQKEKLIKYICDNNLLSFSINVVVYDAGDTIEIMMCGEKNIIRNASKEFTNNEMHIFDDIADIVFNDNNSLNNIKNFFNLKSDNEIVNFAKQRGYNGAKYLCDWKEYKVYEPYMDDKQVSYIGLPLVILANNYGEIRMSTSNEAMSILNDNLINDNNMENLSDSLNKQLRREQLIEIKNNFVNERKLYSNKSIDIYLNCLNGIEDMLKKYIYEDDNRFINGYRLLGKWISPDDAIDYLFDNISGNTIIRPPEIPSEKSLMELQNNQDNYYKDGIICNREKDMILKLIEDIKKYLYSSNTKTLLSNDNLVEKKSNYNQVNYLINNIDNKIAESEVEKNKIDKAIASNLEEVSKYSILNKTIEELHSAKKKFINDWNILLFNTLDEHWAMNSATYRVHIHSIVDAILRRKQDNKSARQIELLNNISECLKNRDRTSTIKIVKQMKQIEEE